MQLSAFPRDAGSRLSQGLLVVVSLWSGQSLVGCPDDTPGTEDVSDGLGSDVGECEPGTVYACPEENGGIAEVCAANGHSTELVTCDSLFPDETAQGIAHTCSTKQCRVRGSVCTAGEVRECLVEGGKQATICNGSGTGWQEGTCHSPDGQDESQCKNNACSVCFPGARKCASGLQTETVLQCNEDGTGWETYETCNGTSQICTGQFCEELCERNIKFNSYIGCDYFAVDLDNAFVPGGEGFFDAAGAQFAVVVANPPDAEMPAFVTVMQKEGGEEEEVLFDSLGAPFPQESLLPGELRVYKLPRRDVNGTTLASLAYKISGNVPILAYQFNPLEDEGVFSNDASLLLPAALLGRDYIAMTREQTFAELRGFVTVVATFDGVTNVSVTVSTSTQAGKAHEGGEDEELIPHMEPGQTRNFKLQKYEVLNLETDGQGTTDLTGTRIVADQLIAVFGGSEAANAPNTARCVDIDPITEKGVCEWDHKTVCSRTLDCVNAGFNTCCADHLEQQLFPLKTWGSHFVASHTMDRGLSKDIYRIMAGEDNTTVRIVPPLPGVSVPILNRGEYYEFESASHFEIHAEDEKPLMVGQFLAAQDAPDPNVGGVASAGDAGTGDPAFMLIVPLEQYRNDFVVLVPGEYEQNFFNLTVPTGALVQVDGEDIPPGDFTIIGSGEYSVHRARFPDPGAHTITSTEPAGIIVYGWDQYVSYAYTGGLDLEEIRKDTPFTPDGN